ncbi:hypothetical protein IP76_00395 [Rhizobium sp. AAP43]|nr:hypothetical protein IP76_00395 [Rhizobium sp. AAP43]
MSGSDGFGIRFGHISAYAEPLPRFGKSPRRYALVNSLTTNPKCRSEEFWNSMEEKFPPIEPFGKLFAIDPEEWATLLEDLAHHTPAY